MKGLIQFILIFGTNIQEAGLHLLKEEELMKIVNSISTNIKGKGVKLTEDDLIVDGVIEKLYLDEYSIGVVINYDSPFKSINKETEKEETTFISKRVIFVMKKSDGYGSLITSKIQLQ